MRKKEFKGNILNWSLFCIIIVLIVIIGIFAINLKNENKEYKNKINEYEKKISSLKSQINENSKQEDGVEGQTVEDVVEVTSEDYYISYSTIWLEPDEYTTISLKSDGTFSMNINLCEGVASISGNYTRTDGSITLTNLKDMPQGFTGSNVTEISFNIQGDGTLKVNNDVGCMAKDSIFSRK